MDKSFEELFGTVIHTYSRAQMIADESLIEPDRSLVREAGFIIPLAITAAAWEDCVAWEESDNERKNTLQDQTGRLWDVLFMTHQAIARRRRGETSPAVTVELYRVPRDGTSQKAELTRLVARIGPGDNGEAVMTVKLPEED